MKWIPSHAAFRNYEEADDGRMRRPVRKVMKGEGRLTPSRSFTFNGDRYTAGQTRVTPDHEVARSEYAHLLVPAYEKETGYAILEFLGRVRESRNGRRLEAHTPNWGKHIFPRRTPRAIDDYWRLSS